MKERIAVTGLGAVSPLGNNLTENKQGLLHARRGIGPLSTLPSQHFPFTHAGQVRDFNPADYGIAPKSLKVMNATIRYAVAAAGLAVQDAGLHTGPDAAQTIGIALGVDGIQYSAEEGLLAACEAAGGDLRNYYYTGNRDAGGCEPITVRDPDRGIHPLWPLSVLANMAVCHIAIQHGIQGPALALSSTDAGAAQAIGEALRLLQQGDVQSVLAGGSFALTTTTWLSLAHHGLLSDCAQMHPFDTASPGCIPGEGAAILVLERLEHARARNAAIYAELSGFGSFFDTVGDPGDYDRRRIGMLSAMQAALQDANLSAADIDCVYASGCAVAELDRQEAQALADLLGERAAQVPVCTIKALTGHLFAADGALNALAAALGLADGFVPGTAGGMPGSAPAGLYLPTKTLKKKHRCAIANTFGFTGEHAALVLQASDGSAHIPSTDSSAKGGSADAVRPAPGSLPGSVCAQPATLHQRV